MQLRAERAGLMLIVRGALCAAVLSVPLGCGLDEKECVSLRSEAYEILNEPHTCTDDTDCLGSEWPGCAKPLSKKNRARIAPFKDKFEAGQCKEPVSDCREVPEVYCKQGLCVFYEKAKK